MRGAVEQALGDIAGVASVSADHDADTVTVETETRRDDGEVVMTMVSLVMYARRGEE